MVQKRVTREEVVDNAHYEKIRGDFRGKVMVEKERRRVTVGGHFTFLFENHLTVLYQVQEMMRVEHIVDEKAIAHELRTYNELIPPAGGLGATLLIEYQNREERAQNLTRLMGIDERVWLAVGSLPPLGAVFGEAQIGETRISSVQYLTFPLQDRHRQAWQAAAGGGTLRLTIDHPHYAHEVVISADTAQALAEDFS